MRWHEINFMRIVERERVCIKLVYSSFNFPLMFTYLTSYNAKYIHMLNEECSYPCQNSAAISPDIVSRTEVRKHPQTS